MPSGRPVETFDFGPPERLSASLDHASRAAELAVGHEEKAGERGDQLAGLDLILACAPLCSGRVVSTSRGRAL